MTRQRHRGELALHVVAALRDLVDAARISLYKVFTHYDDVLVGPWALADVDGARCLDDGIALPADMAMLDHFPHLREGLTRREGRAKPSRDTAHQVFALRRTSGPLVGIVDVETAAPITGRRRDIVDGLLTLMLNCLDMLDYSETDTLTGLLNRKTFDRFLIGILSSITADVAGGRYPARRQTRSDLTQHWLGVVDVDHFKQINDRHGHLIGDEVLILIAHLMKSSFRFQDRLFRFGGEEFVVLLKPTELDNAERAFERFRHRMKEHRFPQAGSVTVSIGFTGIGPNDNPADVLGQADEALYWAKGHGRNRTCSYPKLCAEGHLAPRVVNTEVDLF